MHNMLSDKEWFNGEWCWLLHMHIMWFALLQWLPQRLDDLTDNWKTYQEIWQGRSKMSSRKMLEKVLNGWVVDDPWGEVFCLGRRGSY